jgi:hypothetical protein
MSDAQPGASSDPQPDPGPARRPDAPSDPRPPVEPARHRDTRPAVAGVGPVVRVLDAVAGLLAGGMLVVGVGLLLAQLLAPALVSAAGWGTATGPGWAHVLAHLLVGLAGEVVFRTRHRRTAGVRVLADAAVVVAALAVIAWAWWP